MFAQVPKPPEGHFNMLYFASAGSFTAKEFEPLPAPLPLHKLFQTLEEKYTGIKEKVLESCMVTINYKYVDMPEEKEESDVMIQPGDEVALIPPVSSG
jgi:molybdopterin converting factor small subunit